jgi:hypothetical protein
LSGLLVVPWLRVSVYPAVLGEVWSVLPPSRERLLVLGYSTAVFGPYFLIGEVWSVFPSREARLLYPVFGPYFVLNSARNLD